MKQIKNYDECMLIECTFEAHIEFNAMPSKKPKFEG